MSNVATLPDKSRSVTVAMAERFGMMPEAFEAVVRSTCIKPDKQGRVASREEFAAFLLVAKTYNLNPITKEIYAFTDRGAVIPIVSVDGWSNLVNSHPQFDGMTFDDQIDEKGNLVAITCNMFRKDRAHPVCVTEYMAECKRPTDPWQKWPRRMLRHKAMIQAARYCFGFSGIYDEDESERIAESRRSFSEPPIPKISAEPPIPEIVIENTPARSEPPIPDVRQEDGRPFPLADKLRDAVNAAVAAKDIDALEAAWDNVVTPHVTSIIKEQYEELQAIYAEGERAFDQ